MSDSVVYGLHAVQALFKNTQRKIKKLYINEERDDDRLRVLLGLAAEQAVPIERLSFKTMNQRFPDAIHQGVVAIATHLKEYTEQDLNHLLSIYSDNAFILILDGITDPHNLGACLRSADAAGVHFVVIPKDKSALLTPVVSKVACGAAEHIPLVRVTNLARAIKTIQDAGVWVYGAAHDAPAMLYDTAIHKSCAIVLGAEGHGLRRLTRDGCDELFSLPMLGSVESLNVSVAAGVTLYEILRQRLYS